MKITTKDIVKHIETRTNLFIPIDDIVEIYCDAMLSPYLPIPDWGIMDISSIMGERVIKDDGGYRLVFG